MLSLLLIYIIVFLCLLYLAIRFLKIFLKNTDNNHIHLIQKEIDKQNAISQIQLRKVELLKESQNALENRLHIIFDDKAENLSNKKHDINDCPKQFFNYVGGESKNLLQLSKKIINKHS